MAARSSPARLVRSSADKPAQIACRRTAWLSQKFDDITLSDRLELLERLSAAAAVAERAARRRAEDVLERRVRRAAVRAPVYGRLELDELRRGDLARRRWRKACRAELLAACGRDPVGRPRVV